MSSNRSPSSSSSPSKFAWRTHPIGKFAKILTWLVAQQTADRLRCRVSEVPRGPLWTAVVEQRMPYLPAVWAEATGRPLTPSVLHNRLYYMFREHSAFGGPLVDTVSAEHPTRSARLRPYVAGVRVCFERISGEIPRELVEAVCADPAPPIEEVLARLSASGNGGPEEKH